MRDYSFGNFISALRTKKGLSQYQLTCAYLLAKYWNIRE